MRLSPKLMYVLTLFVGFLFAGLLTARVEMLPAARILPAGYAEYENPYGRYAVAIPTAWHLHRPLPLAGAAAAREDDGRLIEVSNVPWNMRQQGGLTAPGAAILTVTYFEKDTQETIKAALQRRGITVDAVAISTTIAHRPAVRIESSYSETVGIEPQTIRYYIDDKRRVYYLGIEYLPSRGAVQDVLQSFSHIVQTFHITKEND